MDPGSLRFGRDSARAGGFTLIELLVVVAIILILISIALPSFLAAVTRSNITASYGDMRSLGTALEMYNVDYKQYPQSALNFAGRRLRFLTTPVAYMGSIPRDRFASDDSDRTYNFGAMDLDRATRWILAGRGPDRSGDTDPIDFYPGFDPYLFIGLIPNFKYMAYSPTNGTISKGDLYFASDGNML